MVPEESLDEEERIEHVDPEEAATAASEEVVDVDPEASSQEIDNEGIAVRRSSDGTSGRLRTGSAAETTGRNISRPGISPWDDNIKDIKEPLRSRLPGLTLSSSTQSLSAAALPYLEDYNSEGRLNASISKRRSTLETIAVQRWRHYTRMARRFQDHPVYQFLIMSSIVLVLFLSDADVASNAGANERVVDGILIALMIFQAIDVVWIACTREHYAPSLQLFTDIVGTGATCFDIALIRDNFVDADPGSLKNIAVRAARFWRVVRITRLFRMLRIYTEDPRIREASHRMPGPTAIARRLSETIGHQIACFVVFVALLCTPYLTITTPWSAAICNEHLHVVEDMLIDPTPDTSESQAAATLWCDISLTHQNEVRDLWQPLSLWSVELGAPVVAQCPGVPWPLRARDLVKLSSPDGLFIGSYNSARPNAALAKLNMYLVLLLLGSFLMMAVILTSVINERLVKPLESIFFIIERNVAAVLGALSPAGDAHTDIVDRNDDVNIYDSMTSAEQAIVKLSKLAAHVCSGAGQGLQLLKELNEDEMDGQTRAWLMAGYTEAGAPAVMPAPRPMPTGRHASIAGSHSLEGRIFGPSGIGSGKELSTSDDSSSAKSSSIELAWLSDVASRLDVAPSATGDVALAALIDSWDLDVFSLTGPELCKTAYTIFELIGVHEAKLVERPVLWNFILEVREMYQDNPYHSFRHAVDVMHTTYRFMALTKRRKMLTVAEQFALAVAALGHDIDHPGVSNSFLTATRDPLAMMYNDSSVLENHHISTLYGLLSNKQCNVLGKFDDQGWRVTRKLIIQAILHTDMTFHFKLVSQLELFAELHSGTVTHASSDEKLFVTPDDHTLLMNILLHTADISNPAKPTAVYDKWVTVVLEEFFAQGDREASLGLPVSAGYDRHTTIRAASQINFIEFVVMPLFASLMKVLPELHETMRNVMHNRQLFGVAFDSEIEAASFKTAAERVDEKAKMAKRLAAFNAKYEPIMETAKVRSDSITQGLIFRGQGSGGLAHSGSTSAASMPQRAGSAAGSQLDWLTRKMPPHPVMSEVGEGSVDGTQPSPLGLAGSPAGTGGGLGPLPPAFSQRVDRRFSFDVRRR